MLNRPSEETLKKILSSNPSITAATYSCLGYPPASLFQRKPSMHGHKCMAETENSCLWTRLCPKINSNAFGERYERFQISTYSPHIAVSTSVGQMFGSAVVPSVNSGLVKTQPALVKQAWRQGVVEIHQHSAPSEFITLVILRSGLTSKAEQS